MSKDSGAPLEYFGRTAPFDPTRPTTTRDGREVRIYATDGKGEFPIHGAIKTGRMWEAHQWRASGSWDIDGPTEDVDCNDLVNPPDDTAESLLAEAREFIGKSAGGCALYRRLVTFLTPPASAPTCPRRGMTMHTEHMWAVYDPDGRIVPRTVREHQDEAEIAYTGYGDLAPADRAAGYRCLRVTVTPQGENK